MGIWVPTQNLCNNQHLCNISDPLNGAFDPQEVLLNRAQKRAAERDMARQARRLEQQGAVDLKAPAPQKAPVISIGYCWNEQRGVSGFWHRSIIKLLKGLSAIGYGVREIPVESGPAIAVARNTIVEAFLTNEDELLLFTDTDIMFEPRDVELLLAANAPIAGALYYNAATGELPVATALVEADQAETDDAGSLRAGTATYAPISLPELPEPPEQAEDESEEDFAQRASAWVTARVEFNKPTPVAGVGLGLTLIRREVIEDVRKTYGKPFEFEGDNGEDLTFCLRAAEFGYETVVVPGARIGHLKVGVI